MTVPLILMSLYKIAGYCCKCAGSNGDGWIERTSLWNPLHIFINGCFKPRLSKIIPCFGSIFFTLWTCESQDFSVSRAAWWNFGYCFDYLKEILSCNGLNKKTVAFCGDNAKCKFGGKNRKGSNNVYAKKNLLLTRQLIGVKCGSKQLQIVSLWTLNVSLRPFFLFFLFFKHLRRSSGSSQEVYDSNDRVSSLALTKIK